jgi:hypothetical protein
MIQPHPVPVGREFRVGAATTLAFLSPAITEEVPSGGVAIAICSFPTPTRGISLKLGAKQAIILSSR